MGGATALRGEAIREALPTSTLGFYETEVDPIDQPTRHHRGEESGRSPSRPWSWFVRSWPSPLRRPRGDLPSLEVTTRVAPRSTDCGDVR